MSRKKTQKILIPRGTVNPNEDTLIEIPSSLKEKPVVIASQSPRSSGGRSFHYANRPAERSFATSTPHSMGGRDVFNSTNPESLFSSPSFEMDDMMLPDLDFAEQEEAMMVQEKLRAFQEARRRFLMEAAKVANKSIQATPSSFSHSFQPDEIPGCSSRSRIKKRPFFRKTRSSRFFDDEDEDKCGC